MQLSHLILWAVVTGIGMLAYPLRLECDERLSEYRYVFVGFTLRIRYEWIQDVHILSLLPCGLMRIVRLTTRMYPFPLYVNFSDGPENFVKDYEKTHVGQGAGDYGSNAAAIA